MAGEVHITDQLLLRLAADKHVRARAPVFARLYGSARNRGCGKCRKRKAGNQAQILQSIKQSLAVSENLRAIVKSATGASTLALHVRAGNKVVRRVV